MDTTTATTRRSFVKGAAMTGALAVSGLAAAQTGTAHADETLEWDEEHEFVVIGAGGAIFAAIAAHNLGHDVVVLEKRTVYGGTMFYSAGAFWVPCNDLMADEYKARETPEGVLSYMTGCDHGHTHDLSLAEDWIKRSPAVFTYLCDELGIPFQTLNVHDYYDYEGSNNGHTCYVLDASGEMLNFPACWQESVSPVVDASGVDIRLQTAATFLVTDESGAVVGVVATDPEGNELRIKAEKGVLLATGSFDCNEEMVNSYVTPKIWTRIPAELTGDGHKMAMEIGADIAHMGGDFGHIMVKGIDDEYGHIMWFDGCLLYPGCIMVGTDGKRFCNESASYDELARTMCNINTNINGHPDYYSENSFVIWDTKTVEEYGFPSNTEECPGWISQFDTLEELADGMGIDKEALLAEVEKFNGYCETGSDPDYRRGEGPYDSEEMFGQGFGVGIKPREGYSNPLLVPVAEPPFYACVAVRGSLGTSGGVVVDKNARALRNGEPIPGLYAAGCVADAMVNGYPGGGFPIFSSVSRSFFALEHALGLGIVESPEE